MDSKVLKYQSSDITVTYDVKRCIHAAECVKSLPQVFDPAKKPWIMPEKASAAEIASVIEACPTGALHYQLNNETQGEKPSSPNRVQLQEDGPIYFFGDIEVVDHEGTPILRDTRFALCRCGGSSNKPACDNAHQKLEWKADVNANRDKMPSPSTDKKGALLIKLMKNGPAILEGNYVMESSRMEPHASDKGIALCRCGATSTKPFCDGAHKAINFEG